MRLVKNPVLLEQEQEHGDQDNQARLNQAVRKLRMVDQDRQQGKVQQVAERNCDKVTQQDSTIPTGIAERPALIEEKCLRCASYIEQGHGGFWPKTQPGQQQIQHKSGRIGGHADQRKAQELGRGAAHEMGRGKLASTVEII